MSTAGDSEPVPALWDAGAVLSEPGVYGNEVVFTCADPGQALTGVRLWLEQEIDAPRGFAAVPGGWELRFALPPVGRLEYLLEVARDHEIELIIDPANPRLVEGVFGDHSWLPLPGYQEPAWLEAEAAPGERQWLEASSPVGDVPVEVWTPAGAVGELPLVISHDGPEMDHLGRLTHYAGAMINSGVLPPFRVALMPPMERHEWYSASPAYAEALVDHVLPMINSTVPISGRPVIMGQSLGGLAALHAAWTHPDAFAGVFSQSGSFFTATLDPGESGFVTWASITAFTDQLDGPAPALPPITIACGTAEENLANNRRAFEALRRAGVDVAWGEIADGHTWTCWRDLLDPHLTDLLRRTLTH